MKHIFHSRMARVGAAICTSYVIASAVNPTFHDSTEKVKRGFRVFSTCLKVVSDDYLSKRLKKDWKDEDQVELDTRNAQRFLALAQKNSFLYVKLGQYVSAHPQVPATYRKVLKVLQDKAPERSWNDVEQVLREEFPDYNTKFKVVERKAIATASVSQVHRGYLPDGTQVCIKVQHRELKNLARSDILALDSVFLFVHFFYKDLEYWRSIWELWRKTLMDELDFTKEAENGARVARHFAQDPRFHIPILYTAHTSPRVLTQEWIFGETLRDLLDKGSDDGSALATAFQAYGVSNIPQVGRAANDFFAEQTLVHGLVHCDPHPANLMVRRRPTSSSVSRDPPWQLVVIDFGMVRQLGPRFRERFCDLWYALVARDVLGAEAATVGMGMMKEDAEALSLALTHRGMGRGEGKLGATRSREEWAKVRAKWDWVKPSDVNAFALRLPSDFSFVLRTFSLARGINESLGGSNRDRLTSFARAALKGRRISQSVRSLSNGGTSQEEEQVEALSVTSKGLSQATLGGSLALALLAMLPGGEGAVESDSFNGGGHKPSPLVESEIVERGVAQLKGIRRLVFKFWVTVVEWGDRLTIWAIIALADVFSFS